MIAFVVSLYYCFVNLENVYKNPVVILSTGNLTSIKEIPFPAVTVCFASKIRRDYLNYTDVLGRVQQQEFLNETDLSDDE